MVCNLRAGVRAKVLSIDAEKQRLSLGLKPSYFGDDGGDPEAAGDEEGTPGDADDDMDAEVLEAMEESSDEEDDWRAGAEILTGEFLFFCHPPALLTNTLHVRIEQDRCLDL